MFSLVFGQPKCVVSMTRFSIHQIAGAGWLVGFPLIHMDKAVNVIRIFELVLITLTMLAVILGMPWMLNRFPTMRKRFCWTDGLTQEQYKAWKSYELKQFRKLGKADTALPDRVMPYFWRLGWFAFVMSAVAISFPMMMKPTFEPSIIMSVLYLAGTLLVFWLTVEWSGQR
jgi:hypothetical protein